jgi:uncharacterized membrane protein
MVSSEQSLAIVGIMVTMFASIAWYLGSNVQKEIQASGIHYSIESNINTGRILGMVFTIVWLVFAGIAILFVLGSGLIYVLAAASYGPDRSHRLVVARGRSAA